MRIELRKRTEEHVRVYFEKTRDPEIRAKLPQSIITVEGALEAYHNSMKPGADSYGRTVYADGDYVGDIWCYGLGQGKDPDAMVSYCIFEKTRWNQGIASKALGCFLDELVKRFGLKSIGAYTYAENAGSIGVLRRNGFQERERFWENGVESGYFQLDL